VPAFFFGIGGCSGGTFVFFAFASTSTLRRNRSKMFAPRGRGKPPLEKSSALPFAAEAGATECCGYTSNYTLQPAEVVIHPIVVPQTTP
jgi:hypothetical protein